MVDSKADKWRTEVEVAVKSGGGCCWVAMLELRDCVLEVEVGEGVWWG